MDAEQHMREKKCKKSGSTVYSICSKGFFSISFLTCFLLMSYVLLPLTKHLHFHSLDHHTRVLLENKKSLFFSPQRHWKITMEMVKIRKIQVFEGFKKGFEICKEFKIWKDLRFWRTRYEKIQDTGRKVAFKSSLATLIFRIRLLTQHGSILKF